MVWPLLMVENEVVDHQGLEAAFVVETYVTSVLGLGGVDELALSLLFVAFLPFLLVSDPHPSTRVYLR